MPRYAWSTRPVRRICATTSFTVLDGTAKPIPTLPVALDPGSGLDLRVDADHLAARVQERATGVARVDRRVGLDDVVDREPVRRLDESLECADDARRHRAVEAEGIADRDHRVTDAYGVGVAHGERSERARRGLDAEDCEVGGRVGPDHFGLHRVAVREAHGDPARVADDVVVRDDVAGLVDDESGAERGVLPERSASSSDVELSLALMRTTPDAARS